MVSVEREAVNTDPWEKFHGAMMTDGPGVDVAYNAPWEVSNGAMWESEGTACPVISTGVRLP
jgi:hypothetical protein